jgi:peroxiredoxin
MTIKVGDRLPNATFRVTTADGPNKPKTTDEIFKGKKVALFAVPGAFTPTCNNLHIPSFLNNADGFKAKGVNTIAVTATANSPRPSAWTSTAPAMASASVPSVTRCWSTMAW